MENLKLIKISNLKKKFWKNIHFDNIWIFKINKTSIVEVLRDI